MRSRAPVSFASRRATRGSVLILVMWICAGLVALTLYFANSMSSELRAADNRVTEVEARQAVAGATRYVGYVLQNYGASGTLPNPTTDYKAEALPVGEAQFWLIGRDYGQVASLGTQPVNLPYWGLVDEASKINLNTANRAMLMLLPNMTDDIADAILAWGRRANANNASSGSYDNTYAALTPPRLNKAAPFESVDELRLVTGVTLDLLFGEDTNRNGALDPNEDDGEASAPRDNQDGQMQAGWLEYLTIYSKQPNTRPDGSRRMNVTPLGADIQGQGAAGLNQHNTAIGQLQRLLTQRGFQPQRINQIIARFGGPVQGGGQGGQPPPINNPTRTVASVAAFMVASRMTPDEYALVHADFTTAATGATQAGLINVNTASVTVLSCIPGIGTDNAATLVAYRQNHPEAMTSFAWLSAVLDGNLIIRAGPNITDQSYQFSADIAAVGHYGRGYYREKVVFDMSTRTPRIVYHQDLTSYGWALGTQVRSTLKGEAQ